MEIQLIDGDLFAGGQLLLADPGEGLSLIPDPQQIGIFLHFNAPKANHHLVFSLGKLNSTHRFTACHRYEPFWMLPSAGTHGKQVPVETQSLLVELVDGNCVLLVPLVGEQWRSTLQGSADDNLQLVAESGDPQVTFDQITGCFIAAGEDPYQLVEGAASSVMRWMGSGRLRKDKPLPAFTDWFGWCTWDAFYQEVDHGKVRLGLQSFAEGGVQPRFLILDDGWQSVHLMPSGEKRLTSFRANQKFPNDLAETVNLSKQEFGIRTFLVWHALNGYWGGTDGEALPGYHVQSMRRRFSPAIRHYAPELNKWWGNTMGVVPGPDSYRFFQDYHRHLRQQGVDGVKVDNQAALEGVSAGLGGRVALMRAYHEALEGSVHTHFGGNLVNCMSCSNEMLYSALNSNLTRTSTDFWPNRPESHGLHLYTNAQVSMWFGEFVHPDWDMFQSGHEMGAYHAAGRAVSGAPVYVSDKPDGHDFDLLRKLVLPDGRVMRPQSIGKPTRDCLFHDPTQEDVLLKIFNYNLEAGVVGVFHARYGEEVGAIHGELRSSDVPGLQAEKFAVYAHQAGSLRSLSAGEAWDISLEPLRFEIFTLVPVEKGFAPVGLVNYFNSAGALTYKSWLDEDTYFLRLRAGGSFLAWSQHQPAGVLVDGKRFPFRYDPDTNRLTVEITPDAAPHKLRIEFTSFE